MEEVRQRLLNMCSVIDNATNLFEPMIVIFCGDIDFFGLPPYLNMANQSRQPLEIKGLLLRSE
jgi:hypothetical protein